MNKKAYNTPQIEWQTIGPCTVLIGMSGGDDTGIGNGGSSGGSGIKEGQVRGRIDAWDDDEEY